MRLLPECLTCNYFVGTLLSDMKTALVPIGNSRGVRLPKSFIEQCNLGGDIEIDVRDDQIVIRSSRKSRQGWDRAFQAMARQGDDALLDDGRISTRWDREEWQWK